VLQLFGQKIDTGKLVRDVIQDGITEIEVCAYGQRLEYLEGARRVFVPRREMDGIEGFGAEEIVIHIRADDILYGWHPDYQPLPLAYYNRIVKDTGLRPVFVGQMVPDWHPYVGRLRNLFPYARFPFSLGLIEDFERIRRSKHICISVSTYSWLAAWLSDAESIHMPIAGFYNPRFHPDVNLLPVNDKRYHFTLFEYARWTNSAEDIERIIAPDNAGTSYDPRSYHNAVLQGN
jgi:hypothetical protein